MKSFSALRTRAAAPSDVLTQPAWSSRSRWVAAAAAAAAARPLRPCLLAQPRARTAGGFSTTAAAAAPVSTKPPRVPAPIPLVPDVATFLSVIGRNMKQHTSKFPTWEALFTLTSSQLRELGVEPPRDRRYLLRWLERFREGRFGIGGDFQFVRDGVAELRVREDVLPDKPTVLRKTVVNVPVPPAVKAEAETEDQAEAEAEAEAAADANATATADAYDLDAAPVRAHGYKVVGARTVAGPYALPLKQHGGARVTVTEGMWEEKRGRKIDGGERRRAEVRFKRRAAERRAERERLGMR